MRSKVCQTSRPEEHIFLITLSRPEALNAIDIQGHWELEETFNEYESDPSLWVAVITGNGKAFCAGADLKEWLGRAEKKPSARESAYPDSGFGALSGRRSRKPILAAVNGLAFGGGMEMVANCDMIVASENASFGLPEVKRGVSASAGALPRLIRTIGLQRASEMAMTGRTITPEEARAWGFINRIVPHKQLLSETMKLAREIAKNSPDSLIYTKSALREGWGVDEATRRTASDLRAKLDNSDNLKEGLRAFNEKREPRWGVPKL